MRVPLTTNGFVDRAELIYGEQIGVAKSTALRSCGAWTSPPGHGGSAAQQNSPHGHRKIQKFKLSNQFRAGER